MRAQNANCEIPCLQQICLSRSDPQDLITPNNADPEIRRKELATLRQGMLDRCPRESWPHDLPLFGSPHPILMRNGHDTQLQGLHEALASAITDILERWWTDTDANFPARMPLEPQEEVLLKWIENEAADSFRPIRECLGSWRPDFLVEEASPCPDGAAAVAENFRICEINARFLFNGAFLAAYGQDAVIEVGTGFAKAVESDRILGGLLGLFDVKRRVYMLKGEEYGHDVYAFSAYLEKTTGFPLIFIQPSELRLVPDRDAPFGKKLCRVLTTADRGGSTFVHEGELVEEILQVGMELHQRELRALPLEMLQHLALRCCNDMRVIFLVHDKRMLGIVLQELESLVYKHKVLTAEQAEILRRGIAPTVLPGSPELEAYYAQCLATPELKDGFLLKPVRGGKGAGILFGDELSAEDWLVKLERSRNPALVPGQTSYIVQRQVKQLEYDVVIGKREEVQRNYLIGTYHAIGGRFVGIGVWRSNPGRICAISHGGSWMVSVMAPR